PTTLSTLTLHDALPISRECPSGCARLARLRRYSGAASCYTRGYAHGVGLGQAISITRRGAEGVLILTLPFPGPGPRRGRSRGCREGKRPRLNPRHVAIS